MNARAPTGSSILTRVEEDYGEDHQDAADATDEDRTADADERAGGGDGDQPGETAVDGHAEIRFAEHQPGRERRGQRAAAAAMFVVSGSSRSRSDPPPSCCPD